MDNKGKCVCEGCGHYKGQCQCISPEEVEFFKKIPKKLSNAYKAHPEEREFIQSLSEQEVKELYGGIDG